MSRPLQVRHPRAPDTRGQTAWLVGGVILLLTFVLPVVVYAFARWFDGGIGITG